MQSGRGFSKSGPFLIELIISILFFSVASAVCMQLFVNAHLISRESNDVNMAVINTQSAAECIKGTNGSAEKLFEYIKAVPGENENVFEVKYDQNWDVTESESYEYKMTIQFDKSYSDFIDAEISVFKTDAQDSIYTLNTKKYIPS